MPEPFGTHHSKMMILLRHDDSAQVVIHTANMIHQDWMNMTQAVWRSPLLPLLVPESQSSKAAEAPSPPIGSGARFKIDLLRYLDAYEGRCRSLVAQLREYDFSGIRAALVASVPRRFNPSSVAKSKHTDWGWPGLKQVLRSIPIWAASQTEQPHINVQVSSIATLTDAWLDAFFHILGTTAPSTSTSTTTSSPSLASSQTTTTATASAKRPYSLFSRSQHTNPSPTSSPQQKQNPKINLIFPTADEIRRSLDGYRSGDSIHMKLSSPAQQRQLRYLKPFLCHWAGDAVSALSSSNSDSNSRATTTTTTTTFPTTPPQARGSVRQSHRRRAAPHIKTYIRFSSPSSSRDSRIDWAMVTSANLSKQAWGELGNKNGEVRVHSYEIGVVVWPGLFAGRGRGEGEGNEGRVEMVPVFGRDGAGAGVEGGGGEGGEGVEGVEKEKEDKRGGTVVGFRMPYDLPLVPYGEHDVPWCATADHLEPDWRGVVWQGYQPRT
ncbi:hypothetical protein M8818_003197 [Zalaria obscura]|uniref:Uncharacterized protein n=1 Tax=Zalaria obscura TaxID=2024903 RepID=A0ACC3SFY8_9PEZI